MNHVPTLVIIGGGLTGLTAAFRLQEHFRKAGVRVGMTVLEDADRLGGKIGTERVDGFTLEHGPDIFLARKPAGLRLCHDLGLDDRLRPTNPEAKGSFIQKDGKLYPLPDGLSAMIPTRLGPLFSTPLLSTSGKLRALLDLVLPARRGDDDESVAAFISRRMGKAVFTQLVDPLLGGIYGSTGDALSLQATFPQLRDLERRHGSLIRGLLAQKKATSEQNAGFVTLDDGLGVLIDTLVARLDGVTLATGQTVMRVEKTETGYRVFGEDGHHDADAVLLATPAYETARFVGRFDEGLSHDLRAIPYGSTAVQWMAFPRAAVPHPLDAYGYLIPRSEASPVLACTWTSTKIPGRAPEGMALFRVFFGRADADAVLQRDDEDLLALARDEMRHTLGIEAAPVHHRLFRWNRAMPQYVLGHPERIARIEAAVADHPGLALAGAAYHGVGIPDCIADAERAADHLAAFLMKRS